MRPPTGAPPSLRAGSHRPSPLSARPAATTATMLPSRDPGLGATEGAIAEEEVAEDGLTEEQGEGGATASGGRLGGGADGAGPRVSTRSEALSRFAALDWRKFFDEEMDVQVPGTDDVFHAYLAGKEGPVLFCLHGGGYTGLSFAVTAARVKECCRIVAIDQRGHGLSRTSNDTDLSIETLCNDLVAMIRSLYGESRETQPDLVLIGHSMGGAVAVRTAALGLLPALSGLVVVDVVEGTALASLAFMQGVLANRPRSFPSVESAIEWAYCTGGARNMTSATVSMPSQLKEGADGRLVWRARLEESEPYWRGWYEGLSDAFLASPVPKLLLLAGTDRLDKPLTIGQMQGKFQMIVFRTAGHAIQEDDPEQFASTLLTFVKRNRIGGGALLLPGRWR